MTLLSPLKDLQHRQPSNGKCSLGAPRQGAPHPAPCSTHLCLNVINELAFRNHEKSLYALIKIDFNFTSKKKVNPKPLKWSLRQDNEKPFLEMLRQLEWGFQSWLLPESGSECGFN